MKVIDLKEFGEWLYKERDSREIRQMDIEKASGISHVMISKYENGANIRVDNLIRILDALGYDSQIMIRRRTNDRHNEKVL